MTMRRLGLLLAGLLALLAMPVRAETPEPAERQIMVMLRLAPPHLRAGPDYGGGYGDDAAQGGRTRIAARLARAHGLTLEQNWPMPMLGVDCFIMTVRDARSTQDAADAVAKDPAVAWSEPVALYEAQAAASHDDALFAAQPAARAWQLEALHGRLTGRGVPVAVIDSGVDAAHPDLAGQVALSRNFAPGAAAAEAHGTAVAGVIAARAGNKVGIAGVAPGARILALRACWQRGERTVCDSLSLAKAIQFAIERKAPVINMSLAGPPGRLLATLLRMGLDKGLTVVAAYDPVLADGGFPASLPGVIAVTDKDGSGGARSVYSAPGRDIPAPQPGGRWSLVDGSSFSAAHVSGLFALMREGRATRLRLASSRPDGGVIDICATFGVEGCGATGSAR
ncbi:subtilisin family serine protease [Sphingobium xanthum]|jgi:subtilisin family serine protease|uniref:S8 family peptidase n=1 Tax=Sphingobium xanthum TaxID=1387165 RepID=UPI001FE42694|nr:S8 family serine peptidase [Sphingobium xanthum]